MFKYKVVIEIEGTGRSISFTREGIENTLNVARDFMWRNLDARPTKDAPDPETGAAKSESESTPAVSGG